MTRQLAFWKQILVIAVVAGIGYAAWDQRARLSELTGISLSKEAPEQHRGGRTNDGVPVIVEPVSLIQSVDRVQAIGDGRANRSITVYPEVSGIVSEIDFDAGDRLKEGDVIVRLNDREARIAVGIAEAKLAEAQRTVERYEALLKRNAIAMAQVDTARTTRRTAELELEQAREALADRTIRAPFDGVVGIPQVEVGDRVTDSTAITSFDDRSLILVEFEVPEIYLKRIKVGHPITATTPGFRGRTFDGRITEINSRVDPQSRSVRLRAALENPDDVLRGGMSFRVTLVLDGGEYPSVPELSLLWERDGSYVWAVEDGKAKKVAVTVVKRAEGRVLVAGNLAPGQLVVVEGTQRLRPGRELSFERPDATAQNEAGL
ncbi:efflux RND transporter periplasmic adaptor subunit [Dichotomicrobium thermohalophilum]|uniref:RND family efflux transporter MFP subunit n=1 Tax=Dichotomicrobium thermohalophilum TaxID=933063 RepID=A0A397Q2Z5_9HYPH|nr:efflux RND transporter periplasmic adaptor subunit [Dichotomicrobium thermohalophilum]RIA55736.1 RND family efflux transporter MFP subunit [Dichotomicrobium thermohalophilum]